MTLSLFRQEAIDHQRLRLHGEVLVYQPVSQRILAWLLIATVAAIVSYLFWGEYARKETVQGFLVPSGGVVQVYARAAGTITEVNVVENQIVKKNDPLLSVLVEQSTEEGGRADTNTLDVIARQKKEIESQINFAQSNANAERQGLTTEVESLNREIEQLERQRAIQTYLGELSSKDVEAAEVLMKKGFLAENEYRRRREAFLQSAQRKSELGQQIVARQYDLAQARNKLAQLTVNAADSISKLRASLLEIDQRATEIEGRRAYVVRAPVDGRVSSLQVSVGGAADGRVPVMAILPSGSRLQAEIYIPSRAIGFVKPNQEVRLLYEAFPHERFGAYIGHVETVSKTILAPGDVSAILGLREPVYRAVVALDSQTIDAEGDAIQLQAGEQLSANIILDRRKLIGWILSPLARLGRAL
ncbi:MAG TPA: HlyD family efflux transporter periplasmic adaptor subunit [Alphaproteobacteria bacterium]|nr:HlyD family efflux transporter periplasmic adaptor subunit [Alphaproteobacteria bacterium]